MNTIKQAIAGLVGLALVGALALVPAPAHADTEVYRQVNTTTNGNGWLRANITANFRDGGDFVNGRRAGISAVVTKFCSGDGYSFHGSLQITATSLSGEVDYFYRVYGSLDCGNAILGEGVLNPPGIKAIDYLTVTLRETLSEEQTRTRIDNPYV